MKQWFNISVSVPACPTGGAQVKDEDEMADMVAGHVADALENEGWEIAISELEGSASKDRVTADDGSAV